MNQFKWLTLFILFQNTNAQAETFKIAFRPSVVIEKLQLQLQTPHLVKPEVFQQALLRDCADFTSLYEKLKSSALPSLQKHLLEMREAPLSYTMKPQYEVLLQVSAQPEVMADYKVQLMTNPVLSVDSQENNKSLIQWAQKYGMAVPNSELLQTESTSILKFKSREWVCDLAQGVDIKIKSHLQFQAKKPFQETETNWIKSWAVWLKSIDQMNISLLAKAAWLGFKFQDHQKLQSRSDDSHLNVSLNEAIAELTHVDLQKNKIESKFSRADISQLESFFLHKKIEMPLQLVLKQEVKEISKNNFTQIEISYQNLTEAQRLQELQHLNSQLHGFDQRRFDEMSSTEQHDYNLAIRRKAVLIKINLQKMSENYL